MPKSSSAGRDSGEPGGESGGAGIALMCNLYRETKRGLQNILRTGEGAISGKSYFSCRF